MTLTAPTMDGLHRDYGVAPDGDRFCALAQPGEVACREADQRLGVYSAYGGEDCARPRG
jgi:hypothetical protein